MPQDFRRSTVADPPASTEGQRECARAEWCTGYRIVQQADGTSKREPGLAYTAFCVADTTLIGEKLGELPGAFTRLEADLGDPVRRNEMVRVPFGPAIPLSEFYDALIRRIAPELCAWAARVRAVKPLSPPPQVPVLSVAAVEHAAVTLKRNLSALLALQPGWMTRTIPRPPGKGGQAPSITDLDDSYGDCEIIRFGIDFVTVMVLRDGTDAGTEILDLHRQCQRALGETVTRPETLDGIPCRSCDSPHLERAEPPSDPSTEADYSRCPECGDRMKPGTYNEWVDWYKAWAESLGPLTCQRCLKNEHAQCIFPGCECAGRGHPQAA